MLLKQVDPRHWTTEGGTEEEPSWMLRHTIMFVRELPAGG